MKNLLFAITLATIVLCKESWSSSINCSFFHGDSSIAVNLRGGILKAGDLFHQEVNRFDMRVIPDPFLKCAPFNEVAEEERKCIVTHSGSDNVNNGRNAMISMLAYVHSIQRNQEVEVDLFLGALDLPDREEFDAKQVRSASVWITGPHNDKTGVPGLYEFKDGRGRVLLRVLNHHSPSWCK